MLHKFTNTKHNWEWHCIYLPPKKSAIIERTSISCYSNCHSLAWTLPKRKSLVVLLTLTVMLKLNCYKHRQKINSKTILSFSNTNKLKLLLYIYIYIWMYVYIYMYMYVCIMITLNYNSRNNQYLKIENHRLFQLV